MAAVAEYPPPDGVCLDAATTSAALRAFFAVIDRGDGPLDAAVFNGRDHARLATDTRDAASAPVSAPHGGRSP